MASPVPRPAATFFHVMWVVLSAAAGSFTYLLLGHVGFVARVCLALVGFVIAIAVVHVALVFVVAAFVIPRLTPGSHWEREVDAYMAAVFPGQWGKRPGD